MTDHHQLTSTIRRNAPAAFTMLGDVRLGASRSTATRPGASRVVGGIDVEYDVGGRAP